MGTGRPGRVRVFGRAGASRSRRVARMPLNPRRSGDDKRQHLTGSAERLLLLAGLGLTLLASAAMAQGGGGRLHRFEVPVTAFRLQVEPVAQVVPPGVPARVRTWIELADPAAGYAGAVREYLASRYEVRAELYAPAAAPGYPRALACPVGGEFLLDGLTAPGRYHLRDIRLADPATGRDFLFAVPDTAAVDVGGDLFIAWVTAEPMTMAEMLAAGIVFDESSYQNYQFVVGFELEGQVVEYAFPVIHASPAVPVTPAEFGGLLDVGQGDCAIGAVDLDISGVAVPGLPPADVRLPGLILIPGSVGFLNGHFSVQLVLCNALPPASGYRLADLTAEAALPASADWQPGDPLSLAPVADGSNTAVQDVLGDTGPVIAPGAAGAADWIVVGHEVGYHEFDLRIAGRLEPQSGEPSWPIEGRARGGVAVRDNPRFSLSFIHPDRVERGAAYFVQAHVTNVSNVPANGFRLSLAPDSMTGVEWLGADYPADDTCPADPAVYCRPVLEPGETVVLSYHLRALRSGKVTATYGAGDSAGLEVGARLVFGVDAVGQPMNPDRLVLPPVAARLGEPLYGRSLAFLGLCHTLSRAQPLLLPSAFRTVMGSSVEWFARAVTEAGLATAAGRDPVSVAATLIEDLAEIAWSDSGFHHTLESSPRGAELKAALAAILDPAGQTASMAAALALHAGYSGDFALLRTALLPESEWGRAVRFINGPEFLCLIPLDGDSVTLTGGGAVELEIIRPASPEACQRFRYSFQLAPGQQVVIPSTLLKGTSIAVEIRQGSNNVAAVPPLDQHLLPLAPFVVERVLKLTPDLFHGADEFGRGLLVLFNRPVGLRAGEAAAHFECIGNEVLLAAPIGSGRTVGLAVNRPVGKFVTTDLVIGQMKSLDGAIVDASRPVWILDPDSPYEVGGRVEGRVRYPDGRGVVRPSVELWAVTRSGLGIRDVCLSRFDGNDDGTFQLDFVHTNPAGLFLIAGDPTTGFRRRVPLVFQADGQVLHPQIILYGSGAVVGQVVDELGIPIDSILGVRIHCGGDGRCLPAILDGEGRFHADGVTVGSFRAEAWLRDGRRIEGTGFINGPDDTAVVLLVAGGAGVTGHVMEEGPDGARGVPHARLTLSVPDATWSTEGWTDSTGAFMFTTVPWGSFRIRCVHPNGGAVATAEGAVAPGGTTEVQVLFTGGGTLEGHVVTPGFGGAWNAVPFAPVHLEKADDWERVQLDLETDGDGRFRVQPIPFGHYRVTAVRPGYWDSVTEHVWVTAGVHQVQLVMDVLAPVQGRVIRADGAAAAGAAVRLSGITEIADEDGRFLIWLSQGTNRYQAACDGEVESGAVDVPADGASLVIRLRGRRTVAGQVRDSSGQGVRVPLILDGLDRGNNGEMVYRTDRLRSMSAADGTYVFEEVWDGPFTVRFSGNAFYPPAEMRGLANGTNLDGVDVVLGVTGGVGNLTGTLYARDGVTPVRPGVPLTLTGQGGRCWDCRTDAGGRFAISGPLPAGTFVLEAEDFYTGDRAWMELYFAADGDMDVTLSMLGRNGLRVHLFHATGERLEDAQLTVSRQGQPVWSARAESIWDTDYAGAPGDPGHFQFNDVWEGSYTVSAVVLDGDTVRTATGGIEVLGDGGMFTLNLVMTPVVTLRGVVRDGALPDGSLVPGAELTLRSTAGHIVASTVTNSEMASLGAFILPAVAVGQYILRAEDFATGRRAILEVDIPSTECDPPPVELVLNPLGSVEGVVVEGDPTGVVCTDSSSLSARRVTIGIHPHTGSPYAERDIEATTGPDGRFDVPGIPDGRVDVRVADLSGVAGYAEAELEPGGTACLVVPLAPTATLTGTIQSADGGGAAYARIELIPLAGGRSYRQTSTAVGTFRLTSILFGDYTLAAWTGSGVNRVSQQINVPADNDVVLVLRGVGALGGAVWNHAGTRPVSGAVLRLETEVPEFQPDIACDDEGAFYFPEVPAGHFRLVAEDRHHGLEGIAESDLADGERIEGLVVVLEPAFYLRGTLRTEDGSAAAHMTVRWVGQRADGREVERLGATADSGNFVFEELPILPGRLEVADPVGGRLRLAVPVTDVDEGAWVDLGILTLDRTPPSVDAVAYWSGGTTWPETAVPLDAHLILTFSEALDAAWVIGHPGWLRLEDFDGVAWQPVGLTVLPSVDGGIYEGIPAVLVDSRDYRLVIDAAVPDANGNPMCAVVELVFRTVDLTPPAVSVVTPPAGAVQVDPTAPVQITFSEPIVPNSGTVDWNRDGVPAAAGLAWSPDNRVLTILPDGGLQSDARYGAVLDGWRDAAGNAMPAPFGWTFDSLDTQPPVVTAGWSGQMFPVPRPDLAVTFADALRGVDPASVHLTLTDAGGVGRALEIFQLSASGAACRPIDELPDGSWTLNVHVADIVGNFANWSGDFTVRRSAVTWLEHQPAAALVVDVIPVGLSVRFQSAHPVAAGTLTAAGALCPDTILVDEGSGVWRLEGSLAPAGDGPVEVVATMTDIYNWTSPAYGFNFVWDGQPPDLTLQLPGPGDICNPMPPLAFTCGDNGTGVDVAGIRVTIDAVERTAEFELTPSGGVWNPPAGADPLAGGGHTVHVTVPDSAGHTAEALSGFALDGTQPIITVTSPATGAGVVADTVVFDITVTDNCDLDADSLVVTVNGFTRTEFVLVDGQIHIEVPWDHDMLAVGDNVWNLAVADSLGNFAHFNGTFQVIRTVALPHTVIDGNDYIFRVRTDGGLEWDPLIQPMTDVRVPEVTVWVDGMSHVMPAQPEGMLAVNGHEIRLTGDLGSDDLNWEKRIFVPPDGYFARVVEWLDNTAPTPVSVAIEMTFRLPEALNWEVVATSNGDAVVEPGGADRWLMLDDDTDTDDAMEPNMPTLGVVFSEAETARAPSAVEITAGQLVLRWIDLVIPAGAPGMPGRLGLAVGVTAQPTRSDAVETLERLAACPAEFLAGVPDDRWRDVLNLNWAGGADPSLSELPPLVGGVSGRLLDATPDAHPLAGQSLLLRGEAVPYRRCRVADTNWQGIFQYVPMSQPCPLPLGLTDIIFGSPECSWLTISQVLLTADEPVAADQTLIVPDSGAVAVTVSLSTGDPLPDGTLRLERVGDGCVRYGRVSRGDGLIPGVMPGDYLLTVASLFGDATQAVTVTAVQTAAVTMVLEQDYLTGRVVDHLGIGQAGVSVLIFRRNSYSETVNSGTTDADGRFVYLDPLREIDLEILARHPDGRWLYETLIRVPADESLDMYALVLDRGGADLVVRTETHAGVPIADSEIQVRSTQFSAFLTWPGRTGDAGEAVFPGLPAGMDLQYSALVDGRSTPAVPLVLESGELRLVVISSAFGQYTITGTVRAADGITRLSGQSVELQREESAGIYVRTQIINADADGAFQFSNAFLPTGRARVLSRWPHSQGEGEDWTDLDAAAGQTDVSLDTRISVIRGDARDAGGTPVSGLVGLRVRPHDPDLSEPTANQFSGNWSIRGAKPGVTYDVIAWDAGGNAYGTTVALPAQQLVLTDIHLLPVNLYAVSGNAFSAGARAALIQWSVELWAESVSGEFYPLGSACTVEEGYFDFGSNYLPTGRALLVVPWPESQGDGQDEILVDVAAAGGAAILLETGVTAVSGDVVDGAGMPIESIPLWVNVYAHRPDGSNLFYYSNPNQVLVEFGRFTVLGMRPGEGYQLEALDETVGYHSTDINFPAGELILDNVQIPPRSEYMVTGRLWSAAFLRPLPENAFVRWERQLAGGEYVSYGWSVCEDTGQFSGFGYFPTGRARLILDRPPSQGDGSDTWEITLTGPETDLGDMMTGWSVVSGAVMDGAGEPVLAVTDLDLVPADPDLPPVLLDVAELSAGVWQALGVAPETAYDVYAWDRERRFYCATLVLPDGVPTVDNVTLAPCSPTCAELHLRLQDIDGHPLAGVYAEIGDANELEPWAVSGQSDAGGLVRLSALPPGAYWIWIYTGNPEAPEYLQVLDGGYEYIRLGDVLVEQVVTVGESEDGNLCQP